MELSLDVHTHRRDDELKFNSPMSSEKPEEFTKESFLDYDQRRTTFGSRSIGTGAGTHPVPNVERVLKISIPYDPVWTRGPTGAARLLLNPTEEQIEIDPCGYVELEYLDDYLRDRLCTVRPISVNGPQITGSGRQLIDIDAPLYAALFDEAESPEDFSIPHPDPDRLTRMTDLLDAHERDPNTRGSHAYTLLNPETRSASVYLTMTQMLRHFFGDLMDVSSPPMRHPIYNELYAMVAERRNHARLAERWAIDSYRKAVSDPTYSIALEILTWLRDEHHLSYDEITPLLDMCRHHPSPIRALCFVLNDLARGMPAEDIPHHSSMFDVDGVEPDEYHTEVSRSFDGINSEVYLRAFFSTFETISLSEGKITKEWWMRDPPAVFPLPIIRMLIHMRDMANWSKIKYNQLLIPTTAPQLSLTQVDRSNLIYDGEVIAGLRYQDPRSSISQHPLRAAMRDSVSSNKISKMTHPKESEDLLLPYWNMIGKETIHNKHQFDSVEECKNWVVGPAPTDSSYRDLINWFL